MVSAEGAHTVEFSSRAYQLGFHECDGRARYRCSASDMYRWVPDACSARTADRKSSDCGRGHLIPDSGDASLDGLLHARLVVALRQVVAMGSEKENLREHT